MKNLLKRWNETSLVLRIILGLAIGIVLGLAAPQITYIVHDLKEAGLLVDTEATTVEEARDSILKALGR